MATAFEYITQGFWTDSVYSAYIPSLLKEYNESFGDAALFTLSLLEEVNTPVGASSVTISDDGSQVQVTVAVRRFIKDGKLTDPPSPFEALQEARFWINKAVSDYRRHFLR